MREEKEGGDRAGTAGKRAGLETRRRRKSGRSRGVLAPTRVCNDGGLVSEAAVSEAEISEAASAGGSERVRQY